MAPADEDVTDGLGNGDPKHVNTPFSERQKIAPQFADMGTRRALLYEIDYAAPSYCNNNIDANARGGSATAQDVAPGDALL